MIQSLIVDKVEFEKLQKQLSYYERERLITIQISGIERNYEYFSYFDTTKYAVNVSKGDDVPQEMVDKIKEVFKEELKELNNKIGEYISLKGEILTLQKLEENDSRTNEDRKGI